MKQLSLQSILQYLLVFLLALGLMWLSLRSLTTVDGQDKFDFLWQAWKQSDKWDLLLMAFLLMVSHMIRAYRWGLLFSPMGYSVHFHSSLLSVMAGYLVNLALPRGGEVSRCYNLLKLEGIPVAVSFGTVVAERGIDLLCLFLVVGLALLLEWTKLSALEMPWEAVSDRGITILTILVSVVLLVGLLAYLFRKSEKLMYIFNHFKKGFFSILRLRKITLFISLSVLMWLLYFVITEVVVLAFSTTHDLSLTAVLTVFAVSSVALAVPLPSGAGSYHVLVSSVLITLYDVTEADAVAVVFVLHTWQVLVTLVFGVISLLISYQLIRWKKHMRR